MGIRFSRTGSDSFFTSLDSKLQGISDRNALLLVRNHAYGILCFIKCLNQVIYGVFGVNLRLPGSCARVTVANRSRFDDDAESTGESGSVMEKDSNQVLEYLYCNLCNRTRLCWIRGT